ncbi:Polyadenylate-binding protein 8 [Diplonema papillatum]|nr:Polyadenylate-binding protein 8 [Diplonema papillatum]KAJ9454979.1 Polyadenylate-binding protein 8 [Diplonema papillatum]
MVTSGALLTLDELLEQCNIKFDTIKGTSRRAVVCRQLAKRSSIDVTDEIIDKWTAQWEEKLAPPQRRPPPAKAAAEHYPGDRCKLFVGGLPLDATENGLRQAFQQFGSVVDARVKRDVKSGRSRGFGFIVFATADEAAAAAAHPSVQVNGKPTEVQLALPSGDPQLLGAKVPECGCKIFVGGLSQDVTEQHLSDYFAKYGSVASTEVKRDHSNGRSRGFGFVLFATPQAAQAAKDARSPMVCGKRVEVLLSITRGHPMLDSTPRGPDPKKKVFVGGLPQQLRESDLAELFSSFGEVTHSEIKRDFSNDRSRGFGFVVFSTPEAAEAARAAKSVQIDGRQVDIQATIKKGDPSLASKPATSPPSNHHGAPSDTPSPPGTSPALMPRTHDQAFILPLQQNLASPQESGQLSPSLAGGQGGRYNVLVQSLPCGATGLDVRQAFAAFGGIVSVEVHQPAAGPASAIVSYADSLSAVRALQSAGGIFVGGMMVDVQMSLGQGAPAAPGLSGAGAAGGGVPVVHAAGDEASFPLGGLLGSGFQANQGLFLRGGPLGQQQAFSNLPASYPQQAQMPPQSFMPGQGLGMQTFGQPPDLQSFEKQRQMLQQQQRYFEERLQQTSMLEQQLMQRQQLATVFGD